VQLLIEHGADVNVRDGNHSTPLHLASSSWSVEAVQLLIEHGADVHARDGSHSTPLHLVASSSSSWELDPLKDSLRQLLENGADVDAEDNKGRTPFQIASSGGLHEIAQLLLDHRAGVE